MLTALKQSGLERKEQNEIAAKSVLRQEQAPFGLHIIVEDAQASCVSLLQPLFDRRQSGPNWKRESQCASGFIELLAGFGAPQLEGPIFCLPIKAPQPPSGDIWLHEIKLDGFRVIRRKNGARVRLYSRPGNYEQG